MAVGAQDYIDQMLVDKYAMEQVDNHDPMVSAVEPEKMFEAMTSFSNMSRNMLVLNQKLSSSCYAINATRAQYKKAATLDESGEAVYVD